MGEKVKLIYIFFTPFCERLQNFSFFFLSHNVCGIFIILNIKDTFSITFGWNFGLLSRLKQKYWIFFHLSYPFLGMTDGLDFPNRIFSFQFSPNPFSSSTHRCGGGRRQYSHTQISVSLNINESICENGDFYDQRYLPVLPFIHEFMCQIQCAYYEFCLIYHLQNRTFSVTFVNLLLQNTHQPIRTMSKETFFFQILKIYGTWQLKLQANIKWHWRCNDDDNRNTQKTIRTHHNIMNSEKFSTHIWFDLWNIQFSYSRIFILVAGFFFLLFVVATVVAV